MPTRFIRADILAQPAYPKPDIPNHFIALDSAAPPLSLPEDIRRQWADTLAEAPLDRTANAAENEVQAACNTGGTKINVTQKASALILLNLL